MKDIQNLIIYIDDLLAHINYLVKSLPEMQFWVTLCDIFRFSTNTKGFFARFGKLPAVQKSRPPWHVRHDQQFLGYRVRKQKWH